MSNHSRVLRMPVAVAWFPASEWAAAREAWAELRDPDLPANHAAYSQVMEQRLRHLASNLGFNPLVAPLTVEGLEAYAHARGDDPGSAEARSAYGAELVSTGHTILWPPGRNDPCWCGSGRKYKRCCGAPR